MKIEKSKRNFVGDTCLTENDMAVLSPLYDRSVTIKDARAVLDLVCGHFGIPVPSLKFTYRNNIRRRGGYCVTIRRRRDEEISKAYKITISKSGENAATLLHEIAHHVDNLVHGKWGHGQTFAACFKQIMGLADGLI